MMLYRQEAESRECGNPLKSGRVRTYGVSGSPSYAFDGHEWFVKIKERLWVRCANVPEHGLWVSGHVGREMLAEKKA